MAIFQTQLLLIRSESSSFVVLQVSHIVSHKMSYRTTLFNVLILFLLYSDQVFFLAGYWSPMVPWFGLEMSCCHSGSNGFAGEYYVLLLSKEPFDRHICLLDCSLAANCSSPMPRISHIFPIPDVACRGTLCKSTVQVSNIDHTLRFYGPKCVYYCSRPLWLHRRPHVRSQLRMQNYLLVLLHLWLT